MILFKTNDFSGDIKLKRPSIYRSYVIRSAGEMGPPDSDTVWVTETMSAFIWFSGKYKFVFFWKSFYFFGKICIILEKFLLFWKNLYYFGKVFIFWKNLYFFGKVFIFLEKFVLPENQMNALIILHNCILVSGNVKKCFNFKTRTFCVKSHGSFRCHQSFSMIGIMWSNFQFSIFQ